MKGFSSFPVAAMVGWFVLRSGEGRGTDVF